jgi:addiction module RelE/StbE family toxin
VAEVIWTDNALKDIEEIAAYIERDSMYYADLIVTRIFEHGNKLEHFPRRGRKVPERNNPDVREIQVKPYRIVYRLYENSVRILTVVHGRRNLRQILRNLFKRKK